MRLRKGGLTVTEKQLCRAAEKGEPVHLNSGPTVRAAVVKRLLTDGDREQQAPLKIRGGRITGALDLESTHLTRALDILDCSFDEPIILASAQAPAVRLSGCHVPSLNATGLTIDGELEINHGFQADHVRLTQARINGSLSLDGAQLTNSGPYAVAASGLTVGQSMWCGAGLTVTGGINLINASIGDGLSFTGARLIATGAYALNGQNMTIGQALFLGNSYSDKSGFTAQGEIRLTGCRIGAFVCCWGAQLNNIDGFALSALGIHVKGAVYLDRGFTAAGQVYLENASIGGSLHLDGASLHSQGKSALVARRAQVGKSLLCRNGFQADAPIDLLGLQADASVDLTGAQLDTCPTLAFNYLRTQSLVLRPRLAPAHVDLRHAKVDVFADDPQSWPADLSLMNFNYTHIEGLTDLPVRDRLNWLKRDSTGYKPQPYEQLRTAYRQTGQEEAARRTTVAKLWHQRSVSSPAGKVWNWILYVTVGYGYRTWQAGIWIIGLLIAGTYVFGNAYPDHLHPTQQPTTTFNPFVYTADLLIPVLDLGQQQAWRPLDTAATWSWSLTAAGWFLTTCVVAGIARILRRE